jgi:sodium transport system ATP-binding protein
MIVQRTGWLLEALNMESIADRRAEGFSQGERMKVCLARALVHDPQNLILDEPTNGLDVMTTRSVRALLQQLRAANKCILLSSHVMQEISTLCDEVVIVAGGKVRFHGTLETLRQQTGNANLEDAFVNVGGVEAC